MKSAAKKSSDNQRQLTLIALLAALVLAGLYIVFQSSADTSSALTTAQCLARPTNKIITLNPSYTSQFKHDVSSTDWTYDARNTTTTAYPFSDLYPFSVSKYNGAPRACWIGGKVVGQQSRDLSWDAMKRLHDGSALRIASDDWYVVDGLRVDNVEDGVDPRAKEVPAGQGNTTNGNGFVLRNAYMKYIRDDCVENDNFASGIVYDSLFDGCYSGISEQPSTNTVDNSQVGETFTLDNVLLRLHKMPGSYKCEERGDCEIPEYGTLFKFYAESNQLIVKNSIIMIEGHPRSNSKLDWPSGAIAQNVKIVWVGTGGYPGEVPSGASVTTDRSIWDNAKANWLTRHGCTTFDDCTRITNPDPIGGDITAPTVSLTAPANGATVSGNVTISATASDNVAVTSVEFLVDGNSVGSDATSPYSISWNSAAVTNASHTIAARAHDGAGNTTTSATRTITTNNATTDTTPPTASITSPASGATVNGNVTITATANDNFGVSSVEFFVDGASIGTDPTTPYSIVWDSTTKPNGSHSVGVKARDAAGNISALNSRSITTNNPDVAPPSQPTNLQAPTVLYNRVNLTWTASTDNVGVTGYNIFRGGISIDTSPTNSYQDNTVASEMSYIYHVVAYDAAGNFSPNSNSFPVTTPQAPDTTPPSAPTGVTGNAVSASQINLSWTASTDNRGVTGYDVYRDGVKKATVVTTSYSDTGLAEYTSYGYFVKAFDAAGNVSSASTPTISVRTKDATPPSAPSNLTGLASNSIHIDLSWTGSTDNVGVMAYDVFRCTSAGCGNFSLRGGTASTNYTDVGQQYASSSYYIKARDAAGNLSPQSNVITIKDTQAPTTPTNVGPSGARTDRSITISWNSSTDNAGVAGYKIFRSDSQTGPLSQIGTSTSPRFEDNSVSAGRTYWYVVSAFDVATPANESAQSSPRAQATSCTVYFIGFCF